ncbi:MAG TPA: hypothetical protein PK298_16865 [Chitinophagaceae bacterium]|nr:hypothetical protein [Chitinophagaceae bacterium]
MKIRLSGTYFDRLLFNIAPWILLMSILFYLLKNDIKIILITYLLATIAFWIMDSAIIFFKYKNPKKLVQKNGLFLGKQTLSKDDIIQITPISDRRFRWSFELVEFKMSDSTTHMIIDRPRTIIQEFNDKPSKTILRLITLYPELRDKISERKYF